MKKKEKRRFPPGADFAQVVDNLDTDFAILETPELTEQREKLMEELADFRGRMLGLSCDVEAQLDALLMSFFHPLLRVGTTGDGLPVVSEDLLAGLFRDFVLRGTQFNAKIRVLESLLSEVGGLQGLLPDNIVKQLDKVRDLRNQLAHNPINLRLAGKSKAPYLKPVLCTHKKDVVLTRDFQNTKWRLFEEVRNILDSTAYELERHALFREDV